MRRIGLAALLLLLAFAGSGRAADPAFPALTGRVVDQVGVLSDAQRDQLTSELAAQETKTGQQVVVAILSSLRGQTIEDYGYQLGRAWGIGQKGKNTGAILLIAPGEHKVRVEVGYGLEGTLTDAKSSDIIHQIILPAFKAGHMASGVIRGTDAVLNVLNGQPFDATPDVEGGHEVDTSPQAQSAGPAASDQGGGIGLGTLAIDGLIFFVIIIVLCSRRGSSLWLPLGLMSQGWGSGGGGSSSANVFSGGGGSFGGGGASGSW